MTITFRDIYSAQARRAAVAGCADAAGLLRSEAGDRMNLLPALILILFAQQLLQLPNRSIESRYLLVRLGDKFIPISL